MMFTRIKRRFFAPIGVRRLDRLAAMLEAIPPEVEEAHFHMRFWAVHNGTGRISAMPTTVQQVQKIEQLDLLDCGMAACAMGWAASTKWFNERGLVWGLYCGEFVPCVKIDESTPEHLRIHQHRMDGKPYEERYLIGFEAAQAFFGISEDDADALFSVDDYPARRESGDRFPGVESSVPTVPAKVVARAVRACADHYYAGKTNWIWTRGD